MIVLVECYNGEQLFAEAGTIGDSSEPLNGPYYRISDRGSSPMRQWSAPDAVRQIAFSGSLGAGLSVGQRNAGEPASATQKRPTSGCDRSKKTRVPSSPSAKTHSGITQTGYASWYGNRNNGRITASGIRYNQLSLTAAHRTLPFGTRVKITNLRNGCCVKVRIADRGPYVPGRIVDLSMTAARRIGIIKVGVSRVRMEILSA